MSQGKAVKYVNKDDLHHQRFRSSQDLYEADRRDGKRKRARSDEEHVARRNKRGNVQVSGEKTAGIETRLLLGCMALLRQG